MSATSRHISSRDEPEVDPSASASVLLARLIDDYAREIRFYLEKLCGNHHDAEELTQDVFIKAFRKIDTLREPAQARRWLYTIAVNHFNDWLAPQKRRFARSFNALSGSETTRHVDRPEDELAGRELGDHLMSSIVALPDRQRVVLLLFAAKGFSYAEIGEMIGISREAAKMNLFHAREKLREVAARYRDEKGSSP